MPFLQAGREYWGNSQSKSTWVAARLGGWSLNAVKRQDIVGWGIAALCRQPLGPRRV